MAATDSTPDKSSSDARPKADAITPPSAEFSSATAKLSDAATWCQAARALATLGDPRALLPLLAAYTSRAEADKDCLFDAMQVLAKPVVLHDLASNSKIDARRAAMHLMRLFDDKRHVAVLERGAADRDSAVRKAAARGLVSQDRDEVWEAALVRLLDSPDRAVRYQIIRGLLRRDTDSARAALERRAAVESDAELRALLVQSE